MNSANFGQELLTQELVTFEKIHVNVSQTLIITTEDRLNLWLTDVLAHQGKQSDWIAPLGLVIAVTLTLSTTTFRDFLFPAATWNAVFLLVELWSAIWLIATLRHLRRPLVISAEIAKLKSFSPTQQQETTSSIRGRANV